MTTRTEFPRPIREIEHTWLTLSDGCRLAARVWLPEDAESDPVPAILEFLPYRKVDGTAIRDARRQPYVAGFGYATVRVDMRGTGESDGLITDEYTEQEHADCLEVMAWLREQPWCDGNLGMWGISWGGFNSLQLAALRPLIAERRPRGHPHPHRLPARDAAEHSTNCLQYRHIVEAGLSQLHPARRQRRRIGQQLDRMLQVIGRHTKQWLVAENRSFDDD